ncbi:MAG: alpha-E domain-containing protein, partial [Methyloceanibacter sp.]
MLSRTAEDLYWMARNMERAENTARMLEVSFRMSMLPSSMDREAEFQPILAIAPGDGTFQDHYDKLSFENAVRYVALDPENNGSIYSLIRNARENARARRASISSEAWETLNATWL